VFESLDGQAVSAVIFIAVSNLLETDSPCHSEESKAAKNCGSPPGPQKHILGDDKSSTRCRKHESAKAVCTR